MLTFVLNRTIGEISGGQAIQLIMKAGIGMRILTGLLIITMIVPTLIFAQLTVPEGKKGELVYIPYPVKITLDGKLDDWKDIPHYEVTEGPYTSGDVTDNGKFTWAVCSDKKSIFISMTMPDRKIIAGRHGTNFWNEDSVEFYFNLSGDMDVTQYGPGIVQANVNATNIGNSDPRALSLTGVRFAEEGYDVTGYAFKIEDGWAVELAVKLDNNIVPYHGFTIGMQFQANGATIKDRDSKLIWSAYDTSDKSWQNPKLFGTGVFYELGSATVPEPSRKNLPKIIVRKVIPLDKLPKVRVNQHGYLREGIKLAIALSDAKDPLKWELVSAQGKVVARGMTEAMGEDLTSRDMIHHIDFSSYKGKGEGFVLRAGELESFPFDIRNDLYNSLKKDAMSYFYQSRAGIAIDESLAGTGMGRPAWYSSDEKVAPFSGPDSAGGNWPARDYTLNAGKGWFDAGDYGKYVVNGGITVWTLLNLYERNPSQFADGSLKIPEAANGVPDILDEVRWEMDFLLGMQVPEGKAQAGMVHHKLHEQVWSPFPFRGEERVDNRFVYEPSTAATLNLAAAAAQMARVIKKYDAEYSAKCLDAAKRAWKAAAENPEFKYGNIPGGGGGNYNDFFLEDEYYWAAVELYLSTGESEYKESLEKGLKSAKITDAIGGLDGPMWWGGVASLGHFSILLHKESVDSAAVKTIERLLLKSADFYLKQIAEEGYRVPLFNYEWGSNSTVLNKLILIAYAYDITKDKKYRTAIILSVDYLLGRNGLCKSFISGYGENTLNYPHHRYWCNDEEGGYPAPPAGVISGGPNEKASDEATSFLVQKEARSKRYADDTRSYSTNEVAINWNAPLAWVTSFIDEQYNPASGVRRAGGFPVWGVFSVIAAIAAIAAVAFIVRKRK